MKVLVAQLYLTLCNPMDYSTGLLCPWNSPGKNTGVVCHVLPSPGNLPDSGNFPDPGIKPRSPVLQADFLPSEPHQSRPKCNS